MRVAIFGAGAIGGHLAGRIGVLDDVTLSVVARGAHLRAIQTDGLRLKSGGQVTHVRPVATSDAGSLPTQDIVFVTLKAPGLPSAAEAIAALLATDTAVVFFSNGIPWWMADRDDTSLLDPASQLSERIGIGRTLGGIVYSSNSVEAPGVIRHDGHDHWIVGEPAGASTPRLQTVQALLARAGLNAEATDDIRRHIWTKLVVNASANPLSALTRLMPSEFASDPTLVAMALALRREVAAIARAMGTELEPLELLRSADDMMHAALRPSMLQDVLHGRAMEVDAILGQAQLFAARHHVLSPVLNALVPLLRGLDRAMAAG